MKKTLQAIRRTTTISLNDLTQQARLPLADIVAVEVGGYTTWEKAEQVVSAFNQLSGMHLAVSDIALHPQESRL